MYCPKCGMQSSGSTFCVNCGEKLENGSAPQNNATGSAAPQYSQPGVQPQTVVINNYPSNISHKSRLASLLLCVFLGPIGVHRFYAGKIGTGLLWLFTGGLFGIGYIVDIIMIATGNFTDSLGRPIFIW